MSDQFVPGQVVSNFNTAAGPGNVAVTITGVTAGSTLVAFALNGSRIAPVTHTVSDGQGSYTAQDTPITDATNLIWAQAFTLTNANAGSHTVTAQFDTNDHCFIAVAEVLAPTVSPVSGAKGAFQNNPGTGANALSSGTVTVTAAATMVMFSADTASTATSDEPTTGDTSRANNANVAIGAWRLSSKAVSANAAGTFTAVTGTHQFVTLAVAILNPSAPYALPRPQGPGVSPSKQRQFQARTGGITPAGAALVAATPGTWSWSGTTAGLAAGASYAQARGFGPANSGPFNPWQFQAQTPGFSSSGPSISATAGTWSWAGTAAALTQLISATPGTWSWSGSTAALIQLVNATPATWSWVGTTATLTQLISATPGTWSWVGTTANLSVSGVVSAIPGAWSWSGTTATLTQSLDFTPGTWSWAGTSATLTQVINATPGAWSWSGTTAQLLQFVTISATPGAWSWAGTTATLEGASSTPVLGGGRKKRRYQIRIGEQIFEGPKEQVEALARSLAIAEFQAGNRETPPVVEIVAPAKRAKAPLVARTDTAEDVRRAYIAALAQEEDNRREREEEEAVIHVIRRRRKAALDVLATMRKLFE